jgi:Transposase, Mutator family
LRAGIMADYADSLPTAVRCFDDDFEACIAHLRLPVNHRRSTRTTNLMERLLGEERRRLKIVPNAFGEKPVLKLTFGALIRAAESWRGLRFTEFELRQLDAPKGSRRRVRHLYRPIRHAISAASFQQSAPWPARSSRLKLTVVGSGLTYLNGSELMTLRRMNAFCAAMSGSLTVATVSRKYCDWPLLSGPPRMLV